MGWSCAYNIVKHMEDIHYKQFDNQDRELAYAIYEFEMAWKKMKNTSKQLDNVVSPLIRKMLEDKSIADLRDLVDVLPKDYRGSRRIYEAMIHIEDEEKKLTQKQNSDTL